MIKHLTKFLNILGSYLISMIKTLDKFPKYIRKLSYIHDKTLDKIPKYIRKLSQIHDKKLDKIPKYIRKLSYIHEHPSKKRGGILYLILIDVKYIALARSMRYNQLWQVPNLRFLAPKQPFGGHSTRLKLQNQCLNKIIIEIKTFKNKKFHHKFRFFK